MINSDNQTKPYEENTIFFDCLGIPINWVCRLVGACADNQSRGMGREWLQRSVSADESSKHQNRARRPTKRKFRRARNHCGEPWQAGRLAASSPARRRTSLALAQPRRGQHPQIIPVAHRPANAGMIGTLKMAGRVNADSCAEEAA